MLANKIKSAIEISPIDVIDKLYGRNHFRK